MEATVKQRLIDYLAFKRVSKAEFGRAIGVSSSYVTSMRNSISPDKIKSIALNYPDLNIQWLLTGDGEMMIDESVGRGASGVVINGSNNLSNSPIDNRQYYSDSPDVLKAQCDLLEERIKEKDAQIKEKDAQINRLIDLLEKLR